MPRGARLVLPHAPMHIVRRGNNKQACFFCDDDRALYLDLLATHTLRTGCAVHAYVLMTNHVHLLLSGKSDSAIASLMKAVGERYVPYINKTYERSGSLWDSRFYSSLVQEDNYFLACHRYIELNPVRAGIAASPADYRWSSYAGNTGDKHDPLLQPHLVYAALAADPASRHAAYKQLFEQEINDDMLAELQRNVKRNRVTGDAAFTAQIAAALGRRANPAKPGRPVNQRTISLKPGTVPLQEGEIFPDNLGLSPFRKD